MLYNARLSRWFAPIFVHTRQPSDPALSTVSVISRAEKNPMLGYCWRYWLNRTNYALRSARQRSRSQHRIRLSLESLEDRAVPTSLNLTPIADNTLYQDPTGHLSNGAG